MKKLASILLSALLCMSMLAFAVSADDNTTEENQSDNGIVTYDDKLPGGGGDTNG